MRRGDLGGGDGDFGAGVGLYKFQGVGDQVGEDLLEQIGVAHEAGEGHLDIDLCLFGGDLGFEGGEDAVDELAQVDGHEFGDGVVETAVGEDGFDEGTHVLQGKLATLGVHARVFVELIRVIDGEEADETLHAANGGLQVVSDTVAEGFHGIEALDHFGGALLDGGFKGLVSALEVLAGDLEIGDVSNDAAHAGPAGCAGEDHGAVLDPNGFALGGNHPVFEDVSSGFGNGVGPGLHDPVAIFVMDVVLPEVRVAKPIVRGEAKDALDLG